MKLQINHITPYLNHKLMTNQGLLVGLEWQSTKWSALVLTNSKDGINTIEYKDLDEVKLILKPLSELTPELLHDIEMITGTAGIVSTIEKIRLGFIDYILMVQLFEQHYDVFGLIEYGLAEVKGRDGNKQNI